MNKVFYSNNTSAVAIAQGEIKTTTPTAENVSISKISQEVTNEERITQPVALVKSLDLKAQFKNEVKLLIDHLPK